MPEIDPARAVESVGVRVIADRERVVVDLVATVAGERVVRIADGVRTRRGAPAVPPPDDGIVRPVRRAVNRVPARPRRPGAS